jgi:hypothetical protein
VGVEHAGLWGIISFSWIGPLLRLGARGGIQESSASPFIPEADDAAVLARQFERKYAALQVRRRARCCGCQVWRMARFAHIGMATNPSSAAQGSPWDY